MNKVLRKNLLVGTVGALMSLSVAAETITLTVAGRTPAKHYLIAEGIQKWMDIVKEKSGGRVEFKYFPAGQLGKDIVKLVQSGAADIGEIPLAYVAKTMPLSGGAPLLPGMFKDACQGSKALTQVMDEGTTIVEAEWKPNGIRPMMTITTGAYRFISKDKVSSKAGFVGKKTRSSGAVMELTLSTVGAVPVSMSSSEMYGAFTNGTLDAISLSLQSMRPWDIHQVASYFVDNVSLGLGGESMMISESSWAKLPADIQKIMKEARVEATDYYCNYALDAESKEYKQFTTTDGMTAVSIKGSDLDDINAAISSARGKWISQHESQGRPAKKVFDELNAISQKMN